MVKDDKSDRELKKFNICSSCRNYIMLQDMIIVGVSADFYK